MSTDEGMPEFLKEDLLGLESPDRTESNPPTQSNGMLFSFGGPNNNLSELFNTSSPFYSPSSDTNPISGGSTPDNNQNKEFIVS